MKLGIAIFPADYAIRPDELARAVEERGFESLFFTDHTHVPATPATRELMEQAHGGVQRHFTHNHDPFVAMTYAAAATQHCGWEPACASCRAARAVGSDGDIPVTVQGAEPDARALNALEEPARPSTRHRPARTRSCASSTKRHRSSTRRARHSCRRWAFRDATDPLSTKAAWREAASV